MEPEVICLCGSTRFADAFQDASLRLTLEGKVVLSIGTNMKADTAAFAHLSEDDAKIVKYYLDVVHFNKILMSDRILVLNVGGYIGESTTREILFALSRGLDVDWLEPDNLPKYFQGLGDSDDPERFWYDRFEDWLGRAGLTGVKPTKSKKKRRGKKADKAG